MSFVLRGWSKEQFQGAALTDRRRIERVVKIGAALAKKPGRSIPQLFETPYEIKAAYNLFKHPEATPEALQSGHRDLVKQKMLEPCVTLLIEDTSEMSWKCGQEIEGLGPVGHGSKYQQGFHLHTVLAVRWSELETSRFPSRRPPLEVLGLADQQYYVRKPIPEGENGDRPWERMHRPRESQLWLNSGSALGTVPSGARWVRVCDRGADMYEYLLDCQRLGHGFVIRAAQDRALHSPGTYLFEQARAVEALGEFPLVLRARDKRPARIARLSIGVQAVSIKSPRRPGAGLGKSTPINCTVIRVWETNPPEGIEPLEWILLVDCPVESFDEALTCTLQYATRWVIEEFHKALKTGIGAERLQLEGANRLFAAIAIMSVVALRLVDFKERIRLDPKVSATESGLTSFELRVLGARLKRELRTIQDVALAIGRLGGHMNRKADGMPGMITLWRGMIELQTLVEGARLGMQLNLGND